MSDIHKQKLLELIEDGLDFATTISVFTSRMTERQRKIAEMANNLDIVREGVLEIDDGYPSEADENGAYVMAWLWVPFYGTDLDKNRLPDGTRIKSFEGECDCDEHDVERETGPEAIGVIQSSYWSDIQYDWIYTVHFPDSGVVVSLDGIELDDTERYEVLE